VDQVARQAAGLVAQQVLARRVPPDPDRQALLAMVPLDPLVVAQQVRVGQAARPVQDIRVLLVLPVRRVSVRPDRLARVRPVNKAPQVHRDPLVLELLALKVRLAQQVDQQAPLVLLV